MFPNHEQPYPPNFDTPESSLRFGMMLAELLHDWFEVMSHVAYQTHRACEFFVQNGGPPGGHDGPFSHSWRSPPEGSNSSIELGELQECLRSMEPKQAAQVLHAVRTMQAMEAMLKKYRSQKETSEGTAW